LLERAEERGSRRKEKRSAILPIRLTATKKLGRRALDKEGQTRAGGKTEVPQLGSSLVRMGIHKEGRTPGRSRQREGGSG